MAKSYLGKISALVTANTSDFNKKLDESAQRTRSFASAVRSQINAAERAASKSLDGIYTSLQKVERALSAAGGRRLSLIDEREANKIRQLASAAEEVYRPLERAAKASEKLGADVRANFQPALVAAQKSAEALNRAIESGGTVGSASYSRVRRQVELTAEAIDRLSEAQASVGGLATGRELRFQNPGLVAALDDARREQERAARIDPRRAQQLGLGAIQGRQFLAAQRAAEANALVEDARFNVARRPDSARFQQDLQAAVQLAREADVALEGATDELRQQVNLEERLVAARERELTLIQQTGAASRRATPVADLLNLRRADEEESAFRSRAADEAERESQATARLVELLNRASAIEQERRSGALARQNAANFDNATAGVLRSQEPGSDLFAREPRTIQTELARTAALRSQFFSLPPDVQQSLEDERRAINNIANAARDGSAGIGTLELANNRMAAAINLANQALNEQRTVAVQSADTLERQARARIGGDIGDVGGALDIARQVDAVIDRVASLRQRIDSLPDGIRSNLVPALQQATTEAAALARNGFGATADQVRRATAEVQRLEQRTRRASNAINFRDQFGGRGRRGIELGLQELSLRSYASELQVIQRALSSASQTARGPGVDSFNRLRTAVARFAAAGTIDTRQARQEITRLREDAIRAAAAVSGISVGNLRRAVGRAGDVGRGGFDNFTLAAQQAVFAIDDFFSVTGGFEQRIRAVGNNLTQLGFILGGTAGLVASLSIVLLSQGALALYRFANNGRTTEDSVKALNETLSRQKSLVEELASAFRSLSSQISSRGFRGATKDAAELSQALDEIRQKQSERVDERNASLSPDVQRTRATIAARERELQGTSDIGRAAIIRADIDNLRREERQTIQRLRQRAALSAGQAIESVDRARRAVSEGAATDLQVAIPSEANRAGDVVRRFRDEQEASNDIRSVADVASLRAASNESSRVAEARKIVESQIAELRQQAKQERGFFGTSYAGRAAEQEIARLEDTLNQLNKALLDSLDTLEREVSRQALLSASRLGNSLESLEQAVGTSAALTLRSTAELTTFVEQLRDAQQRLADAVSSGDEESAQAAREEIEALREATSQYTSAANAVSQFAEALNRVSNQLAATVLSEAESAAEQARRQANAAGAAASRGPAAADEAEFQDRRRRQLEAEATQAREQEAEIRRQNNDAVRRFEDDARSGRLDAETQALIRQRDAAQSEIDNARDSGKTVPADAVERRDTAQRQLDQRFENSPAGRAAADRADRFDVEQAARRQREDDIRRGREISRTPAEAAGRQLADDLRGLQAAFDDLPAAQQNARELARDQQRVTTEALRSTAPAIFGLADQVQNAVLQGPSRAALQASDVTTAQGAAELNRLLRGDDSARNQDLVELQKQSNSLQELVNIARQNGAPPGVLDL
jgi:hypothetical protein